MVRVPFVISIMIHQDLIRASIEKPVYKEKLRLRSYGTPKLSDTVFLELKKKYRSIVYKRRTALLLSDAYQSIREGRIIGASGQVAHELDYFLQQNQIERQTFIAYDRVALFGVAEPDLRVTFDSNIRYRTDAVLLEEGDYGELILDPDRMILEIKVQDSYPIWLVHLLEKFEIYPGSFSKYGTVYRDKLFVSKEKV